MVIDRGIVVTSTQRPRSAGESIPSQGERASVRLGLALQAVAVALLAAGIGLRLAEYALNRSLWLDEAFLALNVKHRSFGELLGTLDFNQAAPAGYLWLEKAISIVFGDSEYALRTVAVLAAVASVPLFFMCARRILAPWAAVLALGLLALTGGLLLHAAEVKPYSSDVLVSIVLLLLALSRWPQRELTLARTLGAGLIGAAAIWISYPSVFVVAGIGAVLLIDAIVLGRRATVRNLLVTLVLACAGLAVLSATVLDTTIGVQSALKTGAPRYFLPFPPSSAADFEWFARSPLFVFRGSAGLPTWAAALFALLFFVGAVSLIRQRAWRTLGLLLSPLPFVLAASAADLYPFGDRFTLFYVPFALLLVAEGGWAAVEAMRAWSLAAKASSSGTVLAVLCAGALLLVAAYSTATAFRNPHAEAIKPALETVQDGWRPGDTLFLYFASQYAFRYYAECDDCGVVAADRAPSLWSKIRLAPPTTPEFAPAVLSNQPTLLVGANLKDEPIEAMEAQLDVLDGRARVWVLFTHTGTFEGEQALATALGALDARGRRLVEKRYDGAALYFYDLQGA